MTAPMTAPLGPTGRRHELKATPRHFAAVLSGTKTVEIRLDDRGYLVGDELLLQEWGRVPGAPVVAYTGRAVVVEVTHLLEGNGLRDGYVALSIRYPPGRVGRTDEQRPAALPATPHDGPTIRHPIRRTSGTHREEGTA